MFKRKRDEPGPGSWECPSCAHLNDPSEAAQLPHQKEHECYICSAPRGKINATFGHHDNRSEDSVSSTRKVSTSTISSEQTSASCQTEGYDGFRQPGEELVKALIEEKKFRESLIGKVLPNVNYRLEDLPCTVSLASELGVCDKTNCALAWTPGMRHSTDGFNPSSEFIISS